VTFLRSFLETAIYSQNGDFDDGEIVRIEKGKYAVHNPNESSLAAAANFDDIGEFEASLY
jgi:hypothetical protein